LTVRQIRLVFFSKSCSRLRPTITKLTPMDIDDIVHLSIYVSRILSLSGEIGLDIVQRSHGAARSRISSPTSGSQSWPPLRRAWEMEILTKVVT
jgi:hypothetical protein